MLCLAPLGERTQEEREVGGPLGDPPDLVELTIEAGSDVAFAYGLLRCGTAKEFEADPDNRLRMTRG